MRYNLEKLEQGDIHLSRLYACGGGAKSKVWLQIKADVWGREIIPVETEETGALGSAILGFSGVMGNGDICQLAQRFVRHGTPVQPNSQHHTYYQKQYKKYRKFREFASSF